MLFRFKVFVRVIMLVVIIVLNSCSKRRNLDKDIILSMVGDSLSGAVDYILEEVPNRRTTSSDALSDYYNFSDSLFASTDDFYDIKRQLVRYLSSINQQTKVKRIPDVEILDESFVSQSILNACSYRNKYWNNHLSLQQFYEYILPYKIGDEEIQDWRTYFQNRYGYVLDSLLKEDEYVPAERFCFALISELKRSRKVNIFSSNRFSMTTRPISLDKVDCATCKDYCDLVTMICRSFGLPVATDGLLYWHTWNALIEKDRTIDFYIEATTRDNHLKEWLDVVGWHNLPKIFRETFHRNPNSLAMIHGREPIPPFFRNPYIKDVTKEYYKGFDVAIEPIKNRDKKYAYLKVWNNGFAFVDWAQRDSENNFNFYNISDSVIYFPSFYVDANQNSTMSYPFVMSSDGGRRDFVPNKDSLNTMTLWRKYFIRRDHNKYLKAMVGGRFIGANKEDFSDAEVLCEISETPKMCWNEIIIDNSSKFRYLKYESPSWSHGNVGEIEFYSYDSEQPLKGKVLGTLSSSSDETTKEKVFDGDVLTYFDSLSPHDSWVGLELETPSRINRIRYISRNDDNFVQRGQEYELMYADFDGWHSMGRKIADADSLVYTAVPQGAIYLLKNRTKGHEERVFSYENNTQRWW